jgi:ribosomal-protein-serine acetyltransferase
MFELQSAWQENVAMEQIRIDERLALRPLEAGDAEALYALIAADREALSRWMPWAAGQTLEGTREFIAEAQSQEARGDGFQAAVMLTGEVSGVAGFHNIDRVNRATAIGYWLASGAQGRGVATAATRALLDHAFGVWDLHRVTIQAAVGNRRSRAIPERLGFVEEGVMRDSQLVGDRWLDGVLYSMLALDWPAS